MCIDIYVYLISVLYTIYIYRFNSIIVSAAVPTWVHHNYTYFTIVVPIYTANSYTKVYTNILY